MWKFFSFSNKKSEPQEIKTFILKEFFNSANQKKAVTRAARESAEDQKLLVAEYRKLIRQEAVLQD